MALELECLKNLKVQHSEVSVIEEKSAKIEEQERMITALSKSLVNSQDDMQKTYDFYKRAIAVLKKEKEYFKAYWENAEKGRPSK